MRSVKHNLFDAFPFGFRKEIDATMPKYAVVQGTERNIAVQVAKFDAIVSDKWRSDPLFHRAIEFVTEMYRPALTCGVVSWPDALAEFDYTKSPGVPFTGYGFRTKEQVIAFPDEFVEFCIQSVNMDAKVVFGTVPKTEFLLITDILADKIRLFSPGPFHFLATQSRLYSEQNRRLKNFAWSGYGFNLFRGGCNTLAKSLQSLGVCFDLDIPRCDKSFPLMEVVYNMRNSMLQNTTAFDVRSMNWVASNLSMCYMLLPDGTVVESPNVNPSGQLNTTPDNILYVSCVLCYALLTADPNATFAEVMAQKIKIFGDDVHGGISPQFKQFYEPGWLVHFLKDKFNLNLTSCHFYPTAIGIHWLGADYGYLRGTSIIVPFYNKERLWDAWRYTEKGNMTEWQTLSKLRSVLILSYPHVDLFNMFSACYSALLRELAGSRDSTTQAILRLGTPNSNELYAFYTGHENFALGVSSHFSQALKEVGGVKSIWMNATQSVKKAAGTSPEERQKQRVASRIGTLKQILRDAAPQGLVSERPQNHARPSPSSGPSSPRGGAGGRVVGLGTRHGQEVWPDGRRVSSGTTGAVLVSQETRRPFWQLDPDNAKLFRSDPSGLGYTRDYDPSVTTGVLTVASSAARLPSIKEIKSAIKADETAASSPDSPSGPVVYKQLTALLERSAQPPVRRNVGIRDRKTVLKFTPAMGLPVKSGIPRVTTAGDLDAKPHPDSHSEYETIQHHGGQATRVVKAVGKTLIGSVGDGNGWLTGENMLCQPLTALWIGGRLGVLTQEFAICQIKKLRLVYRTLSSDLENGGIVLTYIPDPAYEFLQTGVDYISRIAEYSNNLELALKLNGELDITPGGGLTQDFTNVDNTALSNMKGFALCIASVPFGSGASDPDTYGHLYLEYEADFSKALLDADVANKYTGTIDWGMAASTPVVGQAAAPIAAAAFSAGTSGAFVLTSGSPPPGEYIVQLVCRNFAFSVGSFALENQSNSDPFTPGRGEILWGRTVIAAGSSFSWTANTRLPLFSSESDAQGGYEDYEIDGAVVGLSDAFQYATVAAPVTFTSTWNATFYRLDRD